VEVNALFCVNTCPTVNLQCTREESIRLWSDVATWSAFAGRKTTSETTYVTGSP